MPCLGVDHHGDRGGHTLIATSRNDAHGQLTAVHTGVGSRGGVGTGLSTEVAMTAVVQKTADGRAVLAPQAFLGDGHVHGHLSLQKGSDLGQIHLLGVSDDVLHVEEGAVGGLGVGHGLAVAVAVGEILPVPRDGYHVGVAVNEVDGHGMMLPCHGGIPRHDQLEGVFGLQLADRGGGSRQESADAVGVGRLQGAQHLQLAVGTARHDTRGHGGFNAVHAVGGGDDHGFDVLDDVAAELHLQRLGIGPQGVAEDGGGVGDGDGLGAAHGRHQLLAEDGGVGLDNVGGERHSNSFVCIRVCR